MIRFICVSGSSLDDCVVEKRREYFEQKSNWIPVESCDFHKKEYADTDTKVRRGVWLPQDCCKKALAFQQRTLGLFKKEFEGYSAVCLAPKTCFCWREINKQVSKGVSDHRNPLTFEDYQNVLVTNEPKSVTNRGFRVKNHSFFTYALLLLSFSQFS